MGQCATTLRGVGNRLPRSKQTAPCQYDSRTRRGASYHIVPRRSASCLGITLCHDAPRRMGSGHAASRLGRPAGTSPPARYTIGMSALAHVEQVGFVGTGFDDDGKPARFVLVIFLRNFALLGSGLGVRCHVAETGLVRPRRSDDHNVLAGGKAVPLGDLKDLAAGAEGSS